MPVWDLTFFYNSPHDERINKDLEEGLNRANSLGKNTIINFLILIYLLLNLKTSLLSVKNYLQKLGLQFNMHH